MIVKFFVLNESKYVMVSLTYGPSEPKTIKLKIPSHFQTKKEYPFCRKAESPKNQDTIFLRSLSSNYVLLGVVGRNLISCNKIAQLLSLFSLSQLYIR